MSLTEKIQPGGRKKILALDGGGIRGILTVEILARIEELLRQKSGAGKISCWPIISTFCRNQYGSDRRRLSFLGHDGRSDSQFLSTKRHGDV